MRSSEQPASNLPKLGGATGKGFMPGQSGNPGGRAKGLARYVRELVGDDGQIIAEFMLNVLHDTTATIKERMDAGTWLADRGWGKAANHAAIEEGDPLGLEDVDRELATIHDQLAARRQAQAAQPATKRAMAGNGSNGATPAVG